MLAPRESVASTQLKEAAKTSQTFELVPSLDDNGRFDTVHTIYLTCAENKEVVAVATQFGIAKCRSKDVCESVIDWPFAERSPLQRQSLLRLWACTF
jgi:hypothetical protein